MLALGEIHRHAVELRDRGFTVIRDSGLDRAAVRDATVACSAEFSRLHAMVEELGIDPVEDSYAFEELDKRHRLRWSFKPSFGRSDWTRLVDAGVPVAAEVIEHLHTLPPHPEDSLAVGALTRRLLPAAPTVGHVGAIVSRPGAKAQTFHADAGDRHLQLARLSPRHRMFNMFVPLVDLKENGAGTMMWPGSHLSQTRADAYFAAVERAGSGRLEDDAVAMGEMEVPGCPAGGIILFDFRLLHRGMPNDTGRERALAHAFLATGFATDGTQSHEAGSLVDAVRSLPEEAAAREERRRALAAEQRQAWLALRSDSAR